MCAAFLIIIGAGVRHSVEREPEYQGKSLDQWLDQLARESDDGEGGVSIDVPSAGAVREFGAKAFPTLLKMLSTRETPMRRAMGRLLEHQHFVEYRVAPASATRRAGWVGFWALEDQAAPVLPEVIRLLGDSDPNIRGAALDALYFVGHRDGASVAGVIESLRDPLPIVRASAAATLAGIDRKMKSLSRRETGCRVAVPILVALFHDADRQVRASAQSALLEIDPAAAARAGLR
jgi:hypothetical protein